MDILILTKDKKHPLELALQSMGKVQLSEEPSPCSLCVTCAPMTVEMAATFNQVPIVYYVSEDPSAQDVDAYLYTQKTLFTSYACILLPEVFAGQTTYLQTRYVGVQIYSTQHLLRPHSFSALTTPKTSDKLNLFINASNKTFANNAWRQLCIAEHFYHTFPDSLVDVYLFNAPTNNCAVLMYENLRIFKDKKLRTFIDFESYQIAQHFARLQNRSVYLMNSVTESLDSLAYYSLQTSCGVVHTSQYLKSKQMGKYYQSFDIDAAVSLIHQYTTEDVKPYDIKATIKLPKSVNEMLVSLTQKNLVKSEVYSPMDVTKPLVIGFNKTDRTSIFTNTCIKNTWEYVLLQNANSMFDVMLLLNQLPSEKVVVIANMDNTLCSRPPTAFLQGFQSKQTPLVACMDLLCHGKLETQDTRKTCVPLTKYWAAANRSTRPIRKFVNSDLLCGTVKAIKSCFTLLLHDVDKNMQRLLGKFMNTYPKEICADDEASLLHASAFAMQGCALSFQEQRADGPSYAELYGLGSFFLTLPLIDDKGQLEVYNTTAQLLQRDNMPSLIKPQNHPEFDFHGNFNDGSKLVLY